MPADFHETWVLVNPQWVSFTKAAVQTDFPEGRCGLHRRWVVGRAVLVSDRQKPRATRASAATTPLITVSMMKVGSLWIPAHLEPEGLSAISIFGALLAVLGSIVAAVAGTQKPTG